MKLKRIITVLVMFALMVSSFPVFAAPAEDLSQRVYMTDFKFISNKTEITSVPVNSDVSAEFYIERTDVGTGNQNYVAMLQMFDNGKLTGITSVNGTAEQGKDKVLVTLPAVKTGSDISGTELSVVVISDYDKLIPLAPAANISSDNCMIKAIKIADKNIVFEANKYDYSLDITINEKDLPLKPMVIPYDMASKIEVSEANGKHTIKSTSGNRLKAIEYNIDVNINVIKNSSLKSISVDGVEIEEFVPHQNIYYVNVPADKNIGEVTCETYYTDAKASVEQAVSLPGRAMITVTASGSESSTYEVRFAKTVSVTPIYIGEKQYYGAGVTVWDVENDKSMPDKFLGNGSGNYYYEAVRLNSRNADYNNATRIGYMDFNAELPPDAEITDASISLNYMAGSLNDFDSFSLQMFNVNDAGWVSAPDSYAANTMPAYDSSVEVTEKPVTSIKTAGKVITENIILDTEKMNKNLNFALRVKEYATGTSYDYMFIYVSEEQMPVLTLSYYSEIFDDGFNTDVKSVNVGGKPYTDFDNSKDKYIIPVDENITEVPDIIVTPYFSSTEVSVSKAEIIPGTTTVTLTSSSGATREIEFAFAKSITVSPAYIGRKEYWGTSLQLWNTSESLISDFLPDSDTYRGEALSLRSFSQNGSNYVRGSAIGYLDFDIDLPDNAVIMDAELTLSYSKSFNNLKSSTETMTPEVFVCSDTDWNTKPEDYGVANSFPEYSSEKINTEAFTPATAQGYHYETVKLDISKLNDELMFAIRVNEQIEGNAAYDWLAVYVRDGQKNAGGHTYADRKVPQLKIVYYIP